MCLCQRDSVNAKVFEDGFPKWKSTPGNYYAVETSVVKKLIGDHIFAGVDLARLQSSCRGGLLVAVTEKRTRGEMDQYVQSLRTFATRAEISQALANEMTRANSPTIVGCKQLTLY